MFTKFKIMAIQATIDDYRKMIKGVEDHKADINARMRCTVLDSSRDIYETTLQALNAMKDEYEETILNLEQSIDMLNNRKGVVR